MVLVIPSCLFFGLHLTPIRLQVSLAFDVDAKILEKGEPNDIMRYVAAWKPAFIYRQTFGHWLNKYGHYLPGSIGRCFADLRAWKQVGRPWILDTEEMEMLMINDHMHLYQFSLDMVRRARQQETDTVYLSKMLKEPDSYTGQLLNDSQLAEEGMGLM